MFRHFPLLSYAGVSHIRKTKTLFVVLIFMSMSGVNQQVLNFRVPGNQMNYTSAFIQWAMALRILSSSIIFFHLTQ